MWLILLLTLSTVHSLNYNPYCWVKDCTADVSETGSFLSKLKFNPYCYFTDCDEATTSGGSWNPQCWFTNCKRTSDVSISFWPSFGFSSEQSGKNNGKASNLSRFSTFMRSLFNIPIEWARENIAFSMQAQRNDGSNKKSWYCRIMSCEDDQENDNLFSLTSLKSYASKLTPSETTMKKIIDNLNPICWYKECCGKSYIPEDVKKLRKLLKINLSGQPFAEDIVSAIEAHWGKGKASKALVMSFHGLPSTGKTQVTQLIAESLFTKGTGSAFVHIFVGDIYFQNEALSYEYQNELYHWIKGNVTICPKQLFIFDSVHSIPVKNLFDEIVPLLHRNIIQGVDFTQAIFIFISNGEEDLIRDKFVELRKENVDREKMILLQFEKVIASKIYSETDKSIYYSFKDLNVIDHYIPFLPLELDHVSEFIRREFKQRGVHQPHQDHIDQIISSFQWKDQEGYKFPKTDLRTILSKISLYATKYYNDKPEL